MFIVFDLDGTLALNEHRVHYIRDEQRDYDAFYAACVDDQPNVPVIETFIAHIQAYHKIEIWSGRSDQVRAETNRWLVSNGINARYLTRMRPAGDHQPDVNLKRAWLKEARKNGGGPDLVYDDRARCVKMWRLEGIACFQVADGDF